MRVGRDGEGIFDDEVVVGCGGEVEAGGAYVDVGVGCHDVSGGGGVVGSGVALGADGCGGCGDGSDKLGYRGGGGQGAEANAKAIPGTGREG